VTRLDVFVSSNQHTSEWSVEYVMYGY